jgi:hypothetical protein
MPSRPVSPLEPESNPNLTETRLKQNTCATSERAITKKARGGGAGEEVEGDSHGGDTGGDLVKKAWTKELRLESACNLSSDAGSCSIASNEPAELTITAAAMSPSASADPPPLRFSG